MYPTWEAVREELYNWYWERWRRKDEGVVRDSEEATDEVFQGGKQGIEIKRH